jgi:Domain of unknown function (DUF4113)
MDAVDTLNRVQGKDTVFFSPMGSVRSWKMRQERLSPRYTTRWQEILEVRADEERVDTRWTAGICSVIFLLCA